MITEDAEEIEGEGERWRPIHFRKVLRASFKNWKGIQRWELSSSFRLSSSIEISHSNCRISNLYLSSEMILLSRMSSNVLFYNIFTRNIPFPPLKLGISCRSVHFTIFISFWTFLHYSQISKTFSMHYWWLSWVFNSSTYIDCYVELSTSKASVMAFISNNSIFGDKPSKKWTINVHALSNNKESFCKKKKILAQKRDHT